MMMMLQKKILLWCFYFDKLKEYYFHGTLHCKKKVHIGLYKLAILNNEKQKKVACLFGADSNISYVHYLSLL